MLSLHSTNSVVAVTLRGVEFLGKCHAASLVSVITMDESVDYSLMRLVDPVRGDKLWHGQQNIAAHHNQTIDRTPSLRPEPRVHSSTETQSDFLPTRPTSQRKRSGERSRNQQNFNSRIARFNFSNNEKSKLNSDKVSRKTFVSRSVHFSEGRVTLCPSTTPLRWRFTRTRSRTSPPTSRRSSRSVG